MENYYDGKKPQVTNATFMVVTDTLGHMRFIPRFAHWQAIANLTSGTPKLNDWLNNDVGNTQTIELQPIQKYKFHVCDIAGTEVAHSEEFYAAPGSPLASGPIAKAKNIPLPDDLIRAYCEYTGAYVGSDPSNYVRITAYPTGSAGGVSVTDIYVPYQVSASLYSKFSDPSWYNISFGVHTEYAHSQRTITDTDTSRGSRGTIHVITTHSDQNADVGKWAFIGNPYNFKIINKVSPGTAEAPLYLTALKNITSDNVSTGYGKDVSGNVERGYLSSEASMSTYGTNEWTLVYASNSKGEVVPMMRTVDKTNTVNGSGCYYLYMRRYGALNFNDGTLTWGDSNIAGAEVFLTNLMTITYHVYKYGTTDAQVSGENTESNADYEESIDCEPSEFAGMTELPKSVTRQLTDYVIYKSLADLNSATGGYTSIADLYDDLSETEKTQGMDLFLTYKVRDFSNATVGSQSGIHFFPDVATAKESKEWSFLCSGLESAAVIYGKQLRDYGKAHEYYSTTNARNYGADVEGLTEAEKSFVQYSNANTIIGGFHFIRRTSPVVVNEQTGDQAIDKETVDNVGSPWGSRYIVSQDTHPEVFLMSPLNDFRRIAETYKEGSETQFREDSWLWGFIGTPYRFEIVNREAVIGNANDDYKRLVIVKATNKVQLVSDYTDENKYERYWTLTQFGTGVKPNGDVDPEFAYSFGIEACNSRRLLIRDRGAGMNTITYPTNWDTDIAYHKSSSFMAYPWNWNDNKYKTVKVNIYKNSVAAGNLVLTKTYTPADRAFIAGDVINGTDGHFYLPVEQNAEKTWRPDGVYTNTVPYDGHLVNIPYELRRRYCTYTVQGGSYTVTASDDEQTLNIIYTVTAPPEAPYFVPESELATFRGKTDLEKHNGVPKRDYYYFLDVRNDLSQHTYVTDSPSSTPRFQGSSSTSRYVSSDPAQAMYYFVGDPYQLRICNVYTDAKSNGSYRNLIRNLKPDGSTGDYGSLMEADDKTYMELESEHKCYWEMVDAKNEGSYGYDTTSSNVNYRIDYLSDKDFALRTKGVDDENTTYYYLGKNSKTQGEPIYNRDGATINARGNKVAAFSDFPDVRHTANSKETTVTAMRPAIVYVSVYDQDEPTKLVTKNEISEFYAMTERFKGVPLNLQRNYCEYTWASTEASPSASNNQLKEDGYFEISDRNLSIYATYTETANSPFSKMVDGKIVLKRNESLSPWFNMSINNGWAWFNSTLAGLTETVYNWNDQTKSYDKMRDSSGGILNNSVVSFPYNRAISAVNDRFHKGMHWALVGDPYNFQLRCQRDAIVISGGIAQTDTYGNYMYTPAYLTDADGTITLKDQDDATWWTWIRYRASSDFFLSESLTRRTETPTASASSAKAHGTRRLPAGYPQPDPSVNPASQTKNVRLSGESSVIVEGNNYGIGDPMRLVAVDDVSANNECFDAVVIVYNKMNEPVATTGWREFARKDAKENGRIPADVQRWGCTYHYWADETMTRYPFTNYNQKDENDNYLIQDGGIVYVNYDYDESLYSSENEYRWINLFFNWDDTQKRWDKELDDAAMKYKAEYYERENTETTDRFVLRRSYDVTVNSVETDASKKAYKYVEKKLYTDTRERWLSSPRNYTPVANPNWMNPSPYGAYVINDEQNDADTLKWAMIGDPYRFILYNYKRRSESGGYNAYYLYYDRLSQRIVNKNFETFAGAKEDVEGLFWTWKVDGTSYRYQRRVGETDASENYTREGLPPSFYQAGAIQTGYLANCDATKKSLYKASELLGSVWGYASFDRRRATEQKDTNVYSSYTKGNKEKYHVYDDNDKRLDYTTFDNIQDATERGETLTKWISDNKKDYALSGSVVAGGTFDGCYIGPNMEQERDTTIYSKKQTWSTEPVNAKKYLDLTGGGSQQGALVLGKADRFLVMPMQERASSVTFHLDTETYADGTAISSKRNFRDNPIPDHTTTNFGVNNTIVLPWMMRRQYCDYEFYVVKDDGGRTPDQDGYTMPAPWNTVYSDSLRLNPERPSNERVMGVRSENVYYTDYSTFWNRHDAEAFAGIKVREDAEGDIYEIAIPNTWKDKHVYLCVKYKPTDDFKAMASSSNADTGAPESVKWLNLMNEEKDNMMRYTRSSNVTGADKALGANVTNDYLWAVEGDPYGFVLRNRYADHGFSGIPNELWKDKRLRTSSVNATLNYNSSAEGGVTFGPVGTATAPGIMSTAADDAHQVYEAMTGNYPDAMMIHPVDACINVKNQNGYKYSGAFMFNGAPTNCPVQLNYMEEWAAMRNVYANWRLERPSVEQLIPYYDRAGYVGALTADVASANAELFDRLKDGAYDEETAEGRTQKASDIDAAMVLVQNPDNIVPFAPGYYRLRAYSSFDDNEYVQEQIGGHYVSGFLHQREKTTTTMVGDTEYPTPLHFYEKAGESSNLKNLGLLYGNEWADGITNESMLEIPDPEFDPSSIFCITRESDNPENENYRFVRLETQGLVLDGTENKMTMIDMPEGDDLTSKNGAIYFEMQDIGQTAFQIRTKAHSTTPNESYFLGYSPNQEGQRQKYLVHDDETELGIYSGVHDTRIHSTKWILEPVGSAEANSAGTTYSRPLNVKMGRVGNGSNYYASVCFPYDVKLPDGAYAFGFQMDNEAWRSVKQDDNSFKLNVAQIAGNDNDSPTIEGEPNMVVPAGVPALIYVTSTVAPLLTEYVPVEMAAPGDCKLTEIQVTNLRNSVMKYQYLTTELSSEDVGTGNTVFVFGQMNGRSGFMRNTNKDYSGVVNNRFMLHNKIYYIGDYGSGGSSSKVIALNFVSLNDIIDDGEVTGIAEMNGDNNSNGRDGDGAIYDMQGRKVERVTHSGVYIINGRKVVIKK